MRACHVGRRTCHFEFALTGCAVMLHLGEHVENLTIAYMAGSDETEPFDIVTRILHGTVAVDQRHRLRQRAHKRLFTGARRIVAGKQRFAAHAHTAVMVFVTGKTFATLLAGPICGERNHRRRRDHQKNLPPLHFAARRPFDYRGLPTGHLRFTTVAKPERRQCAIRLKFSYCSPRDA